MARAVKPPEQSKTPPPLVAAVGFSSQDLEPVEKFLAHLPVEASLAVVLVPRADAQTSPELNERLQAQSPLPVREAGDGVELQPNHVYLLPAGSVFSFHEGAFRKARRSGPSRHGRPIDTFFCALADGVGSVAVGLLLRSTGYDGLQGLLSIKSEGGVTLAQEGSEHAKADQDSSVAAGAVDLFLSPEAMAEELHQLAQHPYLGAPGAGGSENLDDLLPRIFHLLRKQTGVDFTNYKPTTLRRRITRRMLLQRFESLRTYYQTLKQSPEALDALYQDLLITVTGLFRDPDAYEALQERVLPRLLTTVEAGQPIRIWVAGCSKGDEVYSIAISLLEVMKRNGATNPVQIFGTDINEKALEKARLGHYPESLSHEISAERLQNFFVKVESGYQITKSIRDLCLFARQDLTRDPPFSRLDLISCRNVLIYLNPNLQYKIMRIFHYALKPEGYLMLGASESIGRASEFFHQVERLQRIFARRGTPAPMPLQLFEPAPTLRSRPDTSRVRATASGGAGPLAEISREADRLTLVRYGPPGVVINEEMEVVQFRGRTGLYLEHPAGTVTHNLLKLAREGLLSDLRAAVRQAAAENVPVRREKVRVRTNGDWTDCNLEVVPFHLASNRERLFLVLFSQEGDAPAVHPPHPSFEGDAEAELARLRQELASTREYLNSINQEQEATLESLQAANEEIQSANEELQSTNEELETATEELQSTNEELTTVNEELHERNVELTQVNNDLTNLLSSVSIPVLILGADLRIRRFTPMARQILRVIPSDVGRPIGDLRPEIEIPDLEKRIQDVLDTLVPQQMELQDREGRWYSVRIRPYRTSENRIDGAVIVYVDIDQLRRSLDEAREARELARTVLATSEQAMLVVDSELRIREANSQFYERYGLEAKDVLEQSLYKLDGGRWNQPELRSRLERLVREQAVDRSGTLVSWREENVQYRVQVQQGTPSGPLVLTLDPPEPLEG